MRQTGIFNAAFGAQGFGFTELPAVHWNLQAPQLYAEALRREEAKIAQGGALVAETGAHTGRSPKDKFIVRDTTTQGAVWWDNNGAMSPEHFDRLLADFIEHAKGRELFAQDLYAAADPSARVKTRVFTQLAWHSLFIRNLLIRPELAELASFVPDLTIVDLPSFRADPDRHGCRSDTVIACDFSRRIVLIGGTSYAGEIKKAVFTYLNFTLPEAGVMPMHCSANSGGRNEVAAFFGLSGTGKTTLSADPTRILIGDDEHGWGRHGVFNFEGGCYAKAIRLSREAEPEIYATTERFGTVMENVTLDPVTGAADFDDDSQNRKHPHRLSARFHRQRLGNGRDGHPRNIVMLTCDAFGVLPPIAKLDPAQAMYHFLSGYTAKVAGTEKGVDEPQATFSTCFGAPFMPRHPSVYGNLLRDLIEKHHVDCWLVNTGWTGGKYGVGPAHADPRDATPAHGGALTARSIAPTSARIRISASPCRPPCRASSRISWSRSRPGRARREFAEAARRLVGMFRENFAKFEKHVDEEVLGAGPAPRISAA